MPVLLSPLLLGGCLGLIAIWPVTTYCFYRALRLGLNSANGRPRHPLTAMLLAMFAAVGWLAVVSAGIGVVITGIDLLTSQ